MSDKAKYTQGSAEMYDMFLKGLPTNILYNILKPPTSSTYDTLKESDMVDYWHAHAY